MKPAPVEKWPVTAWVPSKDVAVWVVETPLPSTPTFRAVVFTWPVPLPEASHRPEGSPAWPPTVSRSAWPSPVMSSLAAVAGAFAMKSNDCVSPTLPPAPSAVTVRTLVCSVGFTEMAAGYGLVPEACAVIGLPPLSWNS